MIPNSSINYKVQFTTKQTGFVAIWNLKFRWGGNNGKDLQLP